MQTGTLVCMALCLCLIAAGCTQLPGIHTVSNSPDPVIGQWIGGEPPQSDMHVIFWENQSYAATTFFIGRGEVGEIGNWTKIERGRYSTLSTGGEITNWTYDSSDDSLYVTAIPQRKYYRYKG